MLYFYSKAIRMEKFLQNKYNKRFAPPLKISLPQNIINLEK